MAMIAHDARKPAGAPRRPRATDPAVRQRVALEQCLSTMRVALEHLSAEELGALREQLDLQIRPDDPALTPEEAALVTHLGYREGEPDADDATMALTVMNAMREFAWRRRRVAESLTAPQVARMLGVSRKTPLDWLAHHKLVALSDYGGVARFPLWQFDPQAPDGILSGLPRVLEALTIPASEKVSWLLEENDLLQRKRPLDALKGGEVESVVRAAVDYAARFR